MAGRKFWVNDLIWSMYNSEVSLVVDLRPTVFGGQEYVLLDLTTCSLQTLLTTYVDARYQHLRDDNDD